MNHNHISHAQQTAAITACINAGQDPENFIDYADLRTGKRNWEYFVLPLKLSPIAKAIKWLKSFRIIRVSQ